MCLIITCMLATVLAECTLSNITASANKCLHNVGIETDSEFMVPVLKDQSEYINFCTRNIIDIKICINSVISSCINDAKVRAIFGSNGAALLAAYDSICAEKNKDYMTCAYQNYAHPVSEAVSKMVTSADAMDSLTSGHTEICGVMDTLHTDLDAIFTQAKTSGDCADDSIDAMHEFIATVMFPCKDIATTYYPCTLKRLNTVGINCYSKYRVSVSNAFIPTPSTTANADRMCRAKNNIQACIKSLITKCLFEPQVNTLFGTTASAFLAGYNCMCAAEHSSRIWHCASTADVTTAMNKFTQSIHNHSLAGTLDTRIQCSLERRMRTETERSLEEACTDPGMTGHWMTYLGTITYPCNDTPTACYPHGFNGANGHQSIRILLPILALILGLHLQLL